MLEQIEEDLRKLKWDNEIQNYIEHLLDINTKMYI